MKPRKVLALGTVLIVLIIILLIIFKPKPELSNIILTGVNLFLVLGYVAATLNMLNMNKISTNLMKSPVISVMVSGWPQEEQETDEHRRINEVALILQNRTNNYAKDVKVTVRAFINEREYTGSYPINGEKDFYVQAGHSVLHKIKMEEEFLNRAGLSIQRMSELANESNRENQFVLKIKISHIDGFGDSIKLPELSWYFDFMSKAWNFIG